MRARKSRGFNPFGVKSGKYNGTPKKGGLKVVIFLATFTTPLEVTSTKLLSTKQFHQKKLVENWKCVGRKNIEHKYSVFLFEKL